MLELDLSGAVFRDKLRGCWVGKNAGGTLGTPIEEAWGRDEPFDIWWYPELREGGLPNDDLEMQLVWLTALEQVGPDLSARDLARYWLDHIGYNWDEYGLSKTNLKLGLEPPVSGNYNNWFKDCMGCPIRSEIWACVAPGMPRLAARYAFEDAICDHAGGESVYGELFNVAIQSSAFVISDRRKLIEIGLSYVPVGSQTQKAIQAALDAIDEGLDWKAARRRVLEATPHHVAQYSPINMGFQVIGLLLGKDFGDAMCITVNCGYDTDSSGGTIGSWWGIVAGDSQLPEKWTAPFADAISTNESWGGVRHLSDGSTPIPSTLHEVVDRLVSAATTITSIKGDQTGPVLVIDEADLYADDSIRELWTRDPLRVDFAGSEFGISIRYDGTPAVVPGTTVTVRSEVRNPHPDSVTGTLSLLVPAGWTAPESQRIAIDAAGSSNQEWTIAVPDRAVLNNSNRLFLSWEPECYPQESAVPVVLIGANALRVSGSVPEGTPREALTWTDISALDNEIPATALPEAGSVSYLQAYFDAPSELEVLLGVDASGPTTAWLNGEELFSADRFRPIRPNYGGSKDGYTDARLKPGFNQLLVEYRRGADDPAFECHVLISSADILHTGLPAVGRTRYPED